MMKSTAIVGFIVCLFVARLLFHFYFKIAIVNSSGKISLFVVFCYVVYTKNCFGCFENKPKQWMENVFILCEIVSGLLHFQLLITSFSVRNT